ncbi:MAG TPA: hypothetical protein VK504_06095 [Vicinamibacterales bacterium]|nr:hypothetical protein [Vicinamibacterales bacterium]
MSEVAMLSKYQIVPGEDPEVTSLRLHLKKNRPVNQAEELGYEAPGYVFTPYPTAMYRDWDPDEREDEIIKVAGKQMLDLDKRRDRQTAEQLVGKFQTRNVGKIDFVRVGDQIEVISEIRERNDREHKALLDEGWADSPKDVPAAKRRFEMRTSALPAAQVLYEDRHLGEQAKREFDAVNEAADDHVTNVEETRKQLTDAGKLPKPKR